MRAYLIALVCLCTMIGELAAASASLDEWRLYKSKHGKHYEPEEDALRLANFLATKQLIERHNADPEATHKLGLNHMADWTREEHEKLNGGKIHKSHVRVQRSLSDAGLSEPSYVSLPKEVDWRKVPNRVAPVKDQTTGWRSCYSSWAFATTGLLEGQQAVRNMSELIPLSEQQLINCSKRNYGCSGGFITYALEYIAQVGGIQREADFKYEGWDFLKCVMDETKFVMSVKGASVLKAGDEDALLKTVANYGPVAVKVIAFDNFYLYKSGVFADPNCNKRRVHNHNLLVVGYGTDAKAGDYWIVKNSFGAKWGEKGYMRMKRGVNMCGIADSAIVANF